MKLATLLALAMLFAPACVNASPSSPSAAGDDLVQVDAARMPALLDDSPLDTLVLAIDRELEYFARRPEGDRLRLADATCSVAEIRGSLAALRDVARHLSEPRLLEGYVRAHFRVYRSTGAAEGALFTGYYEPVLEARHGRQGAFVYPIYRLPAELDQASIPHSPARWTLASMLGLGGKGDDAYFSRADIDGAGALAGRGLELAWLADPVARFFLHVQGSGILRFESGASTRVGYAGTNRRPYTSIGRILAAEGAFGDEHASAPVIQRWLTAHPERRDGVLAENARYVFFREAPDGPVGKLGVKLTAGRSIAVDTALYPLGLLAFVDTQAPVVDAAGNAAGLQPLQRFVLVQDTGGAITGPGRVDLFFGSGERPGLEAGYLSSRGELYFLIPRCR